MGHRPPDRSRRQVLKQIGTATGVSAIGLAGVAQAEENRAHIDQFDPDDTNEVTQALKKAYSFDSEQAAIRAIEELPEEQSSALIEANRVHDVDEEIEVVTSPEIGNGVVSAQAHSWLTSRYTITTRAKNLANMGLCKFSHHVTFQFNGNKVRNLSHYKTVGSGGIGWRFDKVTTKRKRRYNNNRYGEFAMAGRFKLCLGKQGCIDSTNIGSIVTALRQGGYNARKT